MPEKTRKRRKRKGTPWCFLLLCALAFGISFGLSYRYTAVHDQGTVPAEAAASDGVWITQNCNIRKGPGTAFEVIGGGHEGEIFEYAGQTETAGEDSLWYSIYFEDGTGWVSEAVAQLSLD